MTDHLFVLSNGHPDRAQDYLRWYADQQLGDMQRVPGVVGGAAYRLVDPDAGARWQVAARYALSTSVDAVLGAIESRAGGDEMPLTDAIDPASVLMLAGTPIGKRVLAANVSDRADGSIYIALTNATDGEDEAFNAWYDGCHLGDVLAIPGFLAAQRFRLAASTAGRPSPWRYLAIYDLAPGSEQAALGELAERAGTAAMPLSPTLATADVYAALFAPLGRA